MADGNLFRDLSFSSESELLETLFASDRIRVERIASSGQTSGIYDQDEDEWFVLLQGRAELLLVDRAESLMLEPGDYLYIKAGCRHQVTYSSEACLWLCIFWKK